MMEKQKNLGIKTISQKVADSGVKQTEPSNKRGSYIGGGSNMMQFMKSASGANGAAVS